MHFSSAVTALLALPALSYAAALPKRQNVDCAQYNLLSVGKLVISNEATNNGALVSVQVRNTQGNQVSWEGIADIKAGTSQMVVNHIGRGSGYKNLRVCRDGAPERDCYYPGGNSMTKVWNMMTSGDRWNFALTVRDGSDSQIQALCGVGAKIVDGTTTTTPIVTTTTTSQAPPTTTTSKTTTTTSVKTTTTTSVRTTTTTSGKTTKTSSTVSMPPATTSITYTKATTTNASARTIQTV